MSDTAPEAPASPAASRRLPPRLRPLITPALLGVAAAVWFLYRIGRPGVSTDEGVTLVVTHRTLAELWHLWHGNDATLMPYYLGITIIRKTAAVLGLPVSDVVLVRSVSGLAMAVAVALLYALVRRHASVSLALTASIVFMVMPGVVRYAQESRPYALMVMISTASWLAWDVVRERPTWTRRVLYIVTIIAGPLIHLFVLLQFAAQLAASIVVDFGRPRDRRLRWATTRNTLVCLVIGGLVVALPVLYMALHGHGQPRGSMRVSLILTTLLRTIVSARGSSAVWPLVLVLALAGVGALWIRNRGLALIAVLWFAVPFTLQAVAAFVKPATLEQRYWTALSTPLALLIAAGIHGFAAALADAAARLTPVGDRVRAASRITAALAAVGVAAIALVATPTNAIVRGPAGHGAMAVSQPVMAVLERTPEHPVLLVDSRFNGYVFAGYGMRYVEDNPYAKVVATSPYAWGFQRTHEEFLQALTGHDSAVFAHARGGGSSDSTLRSVASELVGAGFARTSTVRLGVWTVMTYVRAPRTIHPAP